MNVEQTNNPDPAIPFNPSITMNNSEPMQTEMGTLSSTYGVSLFFKRWAATYIDTILLGSLIGLVLSVDEAYSFFVMLGVILFVLCYYILLEGLTGYTAGKFALRIRAVNSEGQAPGLVKSLLRTVVRIVDTNPFLAGGLPAGITVLVTKKKQRLGDMAANTFVVKTRDLSPLSKKSTIAFIAGFSIFALISVCSLIAGISTLIHSEDGDDIYVSRDKQFQIVTPSAWMNDPTLMEEANISIANRFSEKYFIVSSFPKSDFEDGFTLEDFQFITEDSIGLEFAEVINQPYEITVNGYPAYQYAFEDDSDDMKISYIAATVETSDHFHQLMAWTLPSKFDQYQAEFNEIISSFNITEAY